MKCAQVYKVNNSLSYTHAHNRSGIPHFPSVNFSLWNNSSLSPLFVFPGLMFLYFYLLYGWSHASGCPLHLVGPAVASFLVFL